MAVEPAVGQHLSALSMCHLRSRSVRLLHLHALSLSRPTAHRPRDTGRILAGPGVEGFLEFDVGGCMQPHHQYSSDTLILLPHSRRTAHCIFTRTALRSTTAFPPQTDLGDTQLPLLFFEIGLIWAVSVVWGGALCAAHALLIYFLALAWFWTASNYSLPPRWQLSLLVLLLVSPASHSFVSLINSLRPMISSSLLFSVSHHTTCEHSPGVVESLRSLAERVAGQVVIGVGIALAVTSDDGLTGLIGFSIAWLACTAAGRPPVLLGHFPPCFLLELMPPFPWFCAVLAYVVGTVLRVLREGTLVRTGSMGLPMVVWERGEESLAENSTGPLLLLLCLAMLQAWGMVASTLLAPAYTGLAVASFSLVSCAVAA